MVQWEPFQSEWIASHTKKVVMKLRIVSMLIGQVMLIGTLPAVAGQSTFLTDSGARVRLAAVGEPTGDRGTYTQKAQDEIKEWRQKLHSFNEKAKAKGDEASSAAETDLKNAWIKAKNTARNLKSAGAEDWESAKASFENASAELTGAWRKIHPNDR